MRRSRGVRAIIDPLTDDELAALMTNLGGHDLGALTDAFATAAQQATSRRCSSPTRSRATGLPFAGHKDNHAGLMTLEQMDAFRAAQACPPGPRVGDARGAGEPARGGALRAIRALCHAAHLAWPPPARRRGAGAADAAAAARHWPEDEHAVGLRRDPLRDRPRPGGERGARPAYRHHQPGCGGVHQSRPVDQPARGVRAACA